MFPTQIVVGKELKQESHTWLKALSDNVQKHEMRELLEKINSLTQKFDQELADSVLEVSIRANKQVIGELRGEDSMCEALLEIMEPEINYIVGEAKKEVAIEVTKEVTRDLSIETASKMLKSGKFTVEEIHEYVPRLTIEEIRALEK